jgi:hypothetical protein
MKRPLTLRHVDQLGLFHPPLKTPVWHALPAEVRQRTAALLTRMLRRHRVAHLALKAREVPDE